MAKPEIFGEKWEKQDHIGIGGQGLIHKALNLETGENTYIIKTLKNQKDKNKRARMFREVSCYRTLDKRGIPKLIDSNVEEYEGTKPLFLITEFIPGPTLEEFIKEEKGRLNLEHSIELILSLLDIVEYCHESQILHRDIKPDNVIVKDGDINNIYLIDFGLSFNLNDNTRITPESEQLTNRFLHLPELSLQASKTDTRTDITYCVGMLFFCLTGIYPQDLSSENNSMPHQKGHAKEIISELPVHKGELLSVIFDQAFTTHIDYRYQSIDGLRQDINKLITLEINEYASPQEKLEQYKSALFRKENDQLFTVKSILDKTSERHNKVVNDLDAELGVSTETIQTSFAKDYKNYHFSNRYGIRSVFDYEKSIWPELSATITGSELIISIKDIDKGDSETERYPISNIDWEKISLFIRNYFLKRLDNLK